MTDIASGAFLDELEGTPAAPEVASVESDEAAPEGREAPNAPIVNVNVSDLFRRPKKRKQSGGTGPGAAPATEGKATEGTAA